MQISGLWGLKISGLWGLKIKGKPFKRENYLRNYCTVQFGSEINSRFYEQNSHSPIQSFNKNILEHIQSQNNICDFV